MVTSVTRGEQRLISIVLGSQEESALDDSVKILDYGFANYKLGVLLKKGQVLKTIQVDGKDVNLISMNDVHYTYPVGDSYIKTVEFIINRELKLPITRDFVMGVAKYILKDDTVIEVNLYSDSDVYFTKSIVTSFIDGLTKYTEIFVIIVVLLIAEAVLIFKNILKYLKRGRQR